jgi:hypothetical protein
MGLLAELLPIHVITSLFADLSGCVVHSCFSLNYINITAVNY